MIKFYGVYGLETEINFCLKNWLYLENNYIIAIPMIRGGGDKG